MRKKERRPAALRESWRPDDRPGPRRRLWKLLRRIAWTGLTIGLLAGFFYLLSQPVAHPNAYLLLLSGNPVDNPQIAPIHFSERDLAQFTDVAPRLAREGSEWVTTPLELKSETALTELRETLDQLPIRSQDVLLVYVSAHGVVIDDEAYLLCRDYDPRQPDAGRIPVSQLLDLLEDGAASTVLLMLETGQHPTDSRLGFIANTFPTRLEQALADSGTQKISLLVANRAWQPSLVSATDRQSLFGFFVQRGMNGAADLDQDGLLRLQEFSQYVIRQVSAAARSAGLPHPQTPRLIRPTAPATADPILLPMQPTVSQTASAGDESSLPPAELPSENSGEAESGPPALGPSNQGEPGPPQGTEEQIAAGKSENSPMASGPEKTPRFEGFRLQSVPQRPTARQSQALQEIWATTYGKWADRLATAWALYASFEDAFPSGLRPVDFAPYAWRELGEQLLAYDTQLRERRSEVEVGDRLREMIAGMQALREGREIPVESRTEILERIQMLRPSPPLKMARLESLGFWESLRSWDLIPKNERAVAAISEFDEAVNQPDPQRLVEWYTLYPEYVSSYEPWVASRLASERGLTWEIQKQAIRLTRLSQQMVSPITARAPQLAERILRADQLRLEAVGLLLDRTVAAWSYQAPVLMAQADQLYRQIANDTAAIDSAFCLRNDLLFRLPYYLRMPLLDGRSAANPLYVELGQLVTLTGELDRALGALDTRDLSGVLAIARRAEQKHNEFLLVLLPPLPFADSGSPMALEYTHWQSALLAPVLSTPARSQIHHWIHQRPSLARQSTETSTVDAGASEATAAIGFQAPLAHQRQRDVEIELARLAQLTTEMTSPFERVMSVAESLGVAVSGDAEGASNPSLDERDFDEACKEWDELLANFYQSLPLRIVSELNQIEATESSTIPTPAGSQRDHLLGASHLVDPRDYAEAGIREGVQARWNELAIGMLEFQQERILFESQDQTPENRSRYVDLLEGYRRGINELPGPRAPLIRTRPGLRLTGPTEINASSSDTVEVELEVAFGGEEPGPIWLFYDANPEILSVEQVKGPEIRPLAGLREMSGPLTRIVQSLPTASPTGKTPSSEFPGLGQAATGSTDSLTPSLMMRPGDRRRMTFRVQPKQAGGDAKLILIGFSEGQFVRHETALRLPAASEWSLAIDSTDSESAYRGGEIMLQPLPNREVRYQFYLRNFSRRARRIELELLAPQVSGWPLPPDGDISLQQLQEFLQEVGPVEPLRSIQEWTVADAEGPHPIPWQEPLPEGEGEPPSPVAEETEDAEPVNVRNGLLLLLTDRDTGQSRVWGARFRPQMPRRFLEVIASYDAGAERLVLRIKALDDHPIPIEGHGLECVFANELAAGTESQLRGRITGNNREVRLFAKIPPTPGRIETVFLNVDDYPRAFIFQIPCWSSVNSIPESANEMRVQIAKPDPNRSYQAPVDVIPVEFLVDAPVGAFSDPNDFLEIGVDGDRDRELSRETTLKLHADRQVDVEYVGLTPRGELRITNRVTDFLVDVPGAGYRNARVNILGRLQVGSRIQWSNPVEIVLDSEPPGIVKTTLRPYPAAPADGELEVKVFADDRNMSGVAGVEVGFADANGKEPDEDFPPVPAEQQPDRSWLAKIPLADRPLGPQTLLYRAVDAVGNRGEWTPRQFSIISPEAMAEQAASQTFSVRGMVYYYKKPVPGAKLQLLGSDPEIPPIEAKEDGSFLIEGIPAGTYLLKASSVIRNKPRFAELEITLGPEEPTGPPVQLELN